MKIGNSHWTYHRRLLRCFSVGILYITSCSVSFSQIPPVISGFSPAKGAIGTAVTITGSNFGLTPASNIVYFGATKASVITATSTQLIVIVPAGATYQPISVVTNNLTGYSRLPFVVTFPSATVLSGTTFLDKLQSLTGTGASPLNVVIGDFDGDGKPDLAATNYNLSTVTVFRNTSDPASVVLTAVSPTLSTGTGPRGIAAGDLDGDGRLDLVVTNYSDNSLQIFRNTSPSGTISFASQAILVLPGGLPFNVAIGDVDGDGRPEVAVPNASTSSVSVLRNNSSPGNIDLTTRIEFPTGSGPQGIAFGDMDGDQKPDLVTANFSSSTISILKNNSTQGTLNSTSFAAQINMSTGGGPRTVALGDVDGDGKLDIVTANETAGSLSVFRNNGVGTGTIAVTSGSNIAGITSAYSIALGDVDGDGKLELAASTGAASMVKIIKNASTPGSLTFGSTFSFATTGNTVGIAMGDLDEDGRSDLAAVNISTNVIHLFGNTIGFLGPTIITFNPAVGYPGSSVTIDGTNFDPVPANNLVKIKGVTAVVDSSSATLIRAIVPDNATPGGKITVNVHNQTVTSTTDFVVDDTAPVISNPSPLNVAFPLTGDVTISVTVTDPETTADYVDISYGPANASDYTAFYQLMTKSGNVWSFLVPKGEFKDSGLQFDIGAYSGGGYTQERFKIGLTYGTSGSDEGIKIPYTKGSTVNDYRIIAIPLDLDAKTVNDVFSDESKLGAYGDKTKWRMYRYSGGSNVEATGIKQIEPGEGYWFLAADGNSFDTGKGNTVGSNGSPVTMPVTQGWNQIGNPYLFKLGFVDLLLYNSSLLLGASFKTYTNDWVDSPTLNAFQGGFIKVNAAGTLTFPGEKNTTIAGNGRTGGESTPNVNPITEDSWEVILHLTDSKHSLNFGGFGMHPQASLSVDKWDDFTVPRFLEYLELDHQKELDGDFYTKDVVPTAENYEWTFEVESSQEGMIEMNWDNTYFGDNDKQLILWDVQQQIPINMREQNKYTVNPSAGKSFKVFYGGKEYVKEKAMPDRMVFHSVFPNPSAGKFTFSFSTTGRPEDKWVSLEVFDILGRKVTTITEGDYTPGYHEVSWDAVDNSGAALTGGIYLTRLKNSATEIPKKIVLK